MYERSNTCFRAGVPAFSENNVKVGTPPSADYCYNTEGLQYLFLDSSIVVHLYISLTHVRTTRTR